MGTQQNDTTEIRESILCIADEISKYRAVDVSHVGYVGFRSKQYERFYSLTQIATDNELIVLTDHKDEKVRAYTFWALGKRNYSDIKIILEKHLTDTASFVFHQGCVFRSQKVNYFFLDILTPNRVDEFCFKLTTQEVSHIYQKIKEMTE